MSDVTPGYLEETLGRFDRVLEVGIGSRTDLASRLTERGVHVIAVDIDPPETLSELTIIQADIGELDPDRFDAIDAVYARRLPPELHRPVATFAAALGCDLYFTTLGGELPIIDVETVTGPRETVFVRRSESDMIL